jgi:hypothetical protein
MAVEVLKVSPTSEARSDKRRDLALMVVTGGGMAMTAFATAGLWFVRDNPTYAFYLAVGGLVNIGIIFTGILGLLVKRRLSVSKSEINISDFNEGDDLIPRQDAQSAVEEAVEEIPAVTPSASTNKPS